MGFPTVLYLLDIPLEILAQAFEKEGNMKLLPFSRKLLRVNTRFFDLTALEGSKQIKVIYHCDREVMATIRDFVENKLLSLISETS